MSGGVNSYIKRTRPNVPYGIIYPLIVSVHRGIGKHYTEEFFVFNYGTFIVVSSVGPQEIQQIKLSDISKYKI